MKEQIKSKFDVNINGVDFDNQYLYEWVRGIIDTLEEYYEIEIDDEDLVLFLVHIRYEWGHNILYAEKNLSDGGVDDYIYDFIIEALTEDINFDMIADIMHEKREENRNKNPLSNEYEGISGFDMLCQKCTQIANVDGNYNDILKKRFGDGFVRYSKIVDDFKQRFYDRQHQKSPINCLA